MRKHFRHSLAIGAAMLTAGAAYAQVQVQHVGLVSVYLKDAESLAKLSGEELRAGLLKNLTIKSDGEMKEAQLYMAYVIDGQVKDVFVSKAFKTDPKSVRGRDYFPGEMNLPGDMFFPGDMLFPGEMNFPGDMLIPGDMIYPEKDRRGAVSKAALSTLARSKHKSGWFFIVIANGGDAQASGVALPSYSSK